MVDCPGEADSMGSVVGCPVSVVKDPVFSAEQSPKYFHHEITKKRHKLIDFVLTRRKRLRCAFNLSCFRGSFALSFSIP